ncbi:hypothetical protein SAMN05444275_12022 [Myroides odoratimimus subsp. xuanwuensis]|nr:hypothetical protein SAMN05444275_12022 [Myroides odoratimimus subsp. xuanwuensis]
MEIGLFYFFSLLAPSDYVIILNMRMYDYQKKHNPKGLFFLC